MKKTSLEPEVKKNSNDGWRKYYAKNVVMASEKLETAMSPKNLDITRCTLVHKRRKIAPEFRSAHREAITLGFATHSSWLLYPNRILS